MGGRLAASIPQTATAASCTEAVLSSAPCYLMCDDLPSTIASLQAKNVTCSPIAEEAWGIHASIVLPSGSEIGLYQPTHPKAIEF